MSRLLSRLFGCFRPRTRRPFGTLSSSQAGMLRANLRALLYSKESLRDQRESAA